MSIDFHESYDPGTCTECRWKEAAFTIRGGCTFADLYPFACNCKNPRETGKEEEEGRDEKMNNDHELAPKHPRPTSGDVPLPPRPASTIPSGPVLQQNPMLPPALPASASSRRASLASVTNNYSVQQWVSDTPSGNQNNGQAMVPWRGPQTPFLRSKTQKSRT